MIQHNDNKDDIYKTRRDIKENCMSHIKRTVSEIGSRGAESEVNPGIKINQCCRMALTNEMEASLRGDSIYYFFFLYFVQGVFLYF